MSDIPSLGVSVRTDLDAGICSSLTNVPFVESRSITKGLEGMRKYPFQRLSNPE